MLTKPLNTNFSLCTKLKIAKELIKIRCVCNICALNYNNMRTAFSIVTAYPTRILKFRYELYDFLQKNAKFQIFFLLKTLSYEQ